MPWVVGWICLICLVVSFVVHAASYALIVPPGMEDGAGFLQLAVMVACLLAVLVGCVAARRVRRERGCSREEASQALWACMPRSAVALGVLVFLYAWGVGAWFVLGVERGSPRRSDDGSFVLVSHGHLIRPLTQEEYWRLQAYDLRVASALWVSFSLWGVLFMRSLPRGIARKPAGARPNHTLPQTGPGPRRCGV